MGGRRVESVRWFPLAYRLDGRVRYLAWCDDSAAPLLLDAAGRIAAYDTLAELTVQAARLHLPLQPEPPPLYDLDRLALHLATLRPVTIDCALLLESWNLFTDIAASLRWSHFDPKPRRTQQLYEKLFWGSNLPAMTPAGRPYRPLWSVREMRALRIVLTDGLRLFSNTVVTGA